MSTFEERARTLVSQMTLDEKISQMMNDAPAIERLGIAAHNWWNECLHGVARAGVATFGKNNFAYADGIGSFIIITSIVV